MTVEEVRAGFGDPGWCANCSREVKPFHGKCPKCGTTVEELGTGDDDPYPEDPNWRQE